MEVAAETRRREGLTIPLYYLLQIEVVLLFGILVENDCPIALLIRRQEIASFYHLYAHHLQEVPRHRHDGYHHLFAMMPTTPCHSRICHHSVLRPCYLFDIWVIEQLTTKRIALVQTIQRNVRRDKTLLVEAHVIVHHVAVLFLQEYRADDECNRNHELQTNQRIAQRLAFLRHTKRTLNRQRRWEGGGVHGRIQTRHERHHQSNAHGEHRNNHIFT